LLTKVPQDSPTPISATRPTQAQPWPSMSARIVSWARSREQR
jgi:hypothetical protein